jgi:energy-coupling factor transport system permease protein
MGVLPAAAPTGRLARRNPSAKLAATLVPAVVLMISLDIVTPLLLVLATLAALPFAQIDLRRLRLQCRLLVVAVLILVFVNAAFAAHATGRVLVDVGPIYVTTGSLQQGLAIGLRALGIALPGIIVLVSTDPVELADSLVQQCKAPAKFAYGTLAAVRLMPLLSQEWDQLVMARRARGIDAGRSPVRKAQLFFSQAFGLLVVAIRRGSRLATAMDARGFDSGLPRSFARRLRVRPADVVMVLTVTLVGLAAIWISVAVGAWKPVTLG